MKLLCIVGPTATGKTALAIALARRWGAEILGADASQVYRGMDIGTGKASPEELGEVQHHLIDVVEPSELFDAGRYLEAADLALQEIQERGRRVIVCGGTGFYLRALLHGLCATPPVAPEIISQLQARHAAGELEALHQELKELDPESAARIAPRDAQRTLRALGVVLSSGKNLSAWQREHAFAPERHEALIFGLRRPREQLRERIATRVHQMVAAGFLEEVRGLMAVGFAPQLRSMGALGYRHLAAVIDGELSLDEALTRTITATRRYAKRQSTWFSKVEGLRWLDAPIDPSSLDEPIKEFWA